MPEYICIDMYFPSLHLTKSRDIQNYDILLFLRLIFVTQTCSNTKIVNSDSDHLCFFFLVPLPATPCILGVVP